MGDEFHFVFQCPFFLSDRIKYIPSYFRIRPNTLKMSTLFNAKDVIPMSKLAKFVNIIHLVILHTYACMYIYCRIVNMLYFISNCHLVYTFFFFFFFFFHV